MKSFFRRSDKGSYVCSSDCEICEGKGYVETGMEGFINRNMEQDCRDTYGPCENAEWDEPDYNDDWREAKERRMENLEREEA